MAARLAMAENDNAALGLRIIALEETRDDESDSVAAAEIVDGLLDASYAGSNILELAVG